MTYRDNGNEQSNKWGDKAHLRIIAPLSSGENVAKTKSATGNIYAPTSRTAGLPRPRAQGTAQLRGRSIVIQLQKLAGYGEEGK